MDSPKEQWNKRYQEIDQLWIRQPDPSLVKFVGPLTPGKALDLGCGEGRNSIYLAQIGWNVTAVDFSDVALERLKKDASAAEVSIDAVCDDLTEYLKDTKSKFDLVLIANIHPPSEERFQMYSQTKHVINAGGYLFIIGHHLDSLGHVGPADPDRLLTESEIRRAFSDFEITVLTKVSDVADSGHESSSLVALLKVV